MPHHYHPGELAVQERAGVRDTACRVAGSSRDAMPPVAQAFLAERHFVVVATVDAGGRPWASLLTGPRGFARALDDRTVRIEATPRPGDPLAQNLAAGRIMGLIALDAAARKQLRLNGRLAEVTDGGITLRIDQAYSNCPRYIQQRTGEERLAERPALASRRAGTLTDEQREWIRRSDTFFIATANPEEGADASHRGGAPGFVRVDGNRLVWPDYAGNAMFNTLGNIAAYPRAGLVFLDFESGATLQLTGRASVDWDAAHAAAAPGAQRLVVLDVENVVA